MGKAVRKLSGIQRWMDSKTGQMFLNYAYSWGASIVILGALFKLTHIAGANLMLFIGMGTEVIVFFLSGFERPWEDDGKGEAEVPAQTALLDEDGNPIPAQAQPVVVGGNGMGGGTIIINGNASAAGETAAEQPQTIDAAALADNLSAVAAQPLPPGMTAEMATAAESYVQQLNELTETLKKVAEQSQRLTRDSEEMETMNRTLTGINRFYEMQLRSVGQQSTTLDEVNTQTKHLAEQLEELNRVYARMVEALKMKVGD